MSILETPRILFRGQVAWDPITTNNYPAIYDEAISEPVFEPGQTVAEFREAAIDDVLAIRSWNPHGTHRSTFFDTEVTGVDLGAGVVTDDSLVGVPVAFQGMLVDCEPYGAFSSQLFFDTMRFGIAGGPGIVAPRTSRFVARYINFGRNTGPTFIAGGASVNWQTCFPKTDGLLLNTSDSPAMAALAEALEEDGVLGLTVRINAYRTIYYDDPSLSNKDAASAAAAANGLIAKLKCGGFQPNPARSLIVGTIGLWRTGEPAHEPGDRALLGPTGNSVATAHARLSGTTLTVDLSNSISETGPDLVKQDLGTLHFVAASPDGSTIMELGAISYADYDKAAYDTGAGIVTLTVDQAAATMATTNDIQLRNDNGSGSYGTTVYLDEQALRPLPTEHNLYINENEEITTVIHVLDRGVPAAAGIPVSMVGAASTTIFQAAATDANGNASFTYTGPQYGAVEGFVLLAGVNPPLPSQIDPLVTPYMYIRSLPLDAEVAAAAPTWDNVYRLVLAKWNGLAPCMDNWLRLDDEMQVRAYGAMLRKLTDPANFELFRYMPVTRDMTDGERQLLYTFLGVDTPVPKSVPFMLKAAAAVPDIDRLSRAHRGG